MNANLQPPTEQRDQNLNEIGAIFQQVANSKYTSGRLYMVINPQTEKLETTLDRKLACSRKELSHFIKDCMGKILENEQKLEKQQLEDPDDKLELKIQRRVFEISEDLSYKLNNLTLFFDNIINNSLETPLTIINPKSTLELTPVKKRIDETEKRKHRKWVDKVRDLVMQPASLENLEDFKMLIKEGTDNNFIHVANFKKDDGNILHKVAMLSTYVSPEYIEIIINAGVALEDQDDKQVWGNTSLMWAIANANNGSAKQILLQGGAGSYVNVQSKNKNAALHLAVGKGYKLWSANFQVLACSNLDLVKELIKNKANVNLKNEDGNTPLHIACARHDVEMIKTLLDAGADPTVTNNAGLSSQEMLELNYNVAMELVNKTVGIHLLDEGEYIADLARAKALF